CSCLLLAILRRSVLSSSANATSRIYSLSLHDALPILGQIADESDGIGVGEGEPIGSLRLPDGRVEGGKEGVLHHHLGVGEEVEQDRKSTRLNSSHVSISYAVFCLKKKKIA